MTEPTERDRETAVDLLFPGSIPDGDVDTRNHIETVAEAIAAARDEGRREERARCAETVRRWLSPRAGIQVTRNPGEVLRDILDKIENATASDTGATQGEGK